MNTDPSAVTFHNGGTTFTGDGVNLYRALTVKQGISLYIKTGMLLTRGATITKLLKIASEYTGKKYKTTEKEKALADLIAWIEAAKASMPIIDERS